jgi:phosphoribosylformylglycinamidine cyclo-ligase
MKRMNEGLFNKLIKYLYSQLSMRYQINISHVRKIQRSLLEQIKTTFKLRAGKYGEPLPIYGHYGGVFQIEKERLVIHCDGVGTKVLVAQQLGKYDTIGIDAVAMNVNDIICLGAEPLVGVDYIALAKEDDFLVSEIMKGLVNGAEESDCAIIGGETAIVPDLLKNSKTFDLTFTVVGRVVNKEVITGNRIRVGDIIIGLESSGLHSNGYTLARKVLDIKKWGKQMLAPTRIYVKPVLEIVDLCDVHGVAHITGGAFSKITRLNDNVGYLFDNMPKPKGIFEALYEKVHDTRHMYTTFNMGIGMVIVVDQKDENTIKAVAKKYGVNASVIGRVNEEKGIWLEKDGKKIDLTL